MHKPLKVGFIGGGRITALRHLPALSRIKEIELVAVADVDPIRLKQVADKFAIPHRYPDVHTLLKKVMVDVIAVCVPVQFHAEIALAALEAGKHVFIEKPLTATLEEGRNLKVKTFVGTSANAVKIQIWTAVIALLLLHYLQLASRFGWSLANLVALLRMNLFIHRDLMAWPNQPFATPPNPQPSFQTSLGFT